MKTKITVLLITCLFLVVACKTSNKTCPKLFKIYNATNAKVNMAFYLNNEVAEQINIEPRSTYSRNGNEQNNVGMPDYFSYVDSMIMMFDEKTSLTYYRNQAPTDFNPFNISHYTQSKSDEDCNDNNEVIYHITTEHIYKAK